MNLSNFLAVFKATGEVRNQNTKSNEISPISKKNKNKIYSMLNYSLSKIFRLMGHPTNILHISDPLYPNLIKKLRPSITFLPPYRSIADDIDVIKLYLIEFIH